MTDGLQAQLWGSLTLHSLHHMVRARAIAISYTNTDWPLIELDSKDHAYTHTASHHHI